MRGLEEIIAINENPAAYYASREPQHGVVSSAERRRREEQQRFHGERVEARQRQNGKHETITDDVIETILDEIIFGAAPTSPTARASELLAEMVLVAAILDANHVARPDDYAEAHALAQKLAVEPAPQDRIQHGIDQPPFINFWADLNDRRTKAGLPEAGYKEARTLFNGGETPVGALTFIGKQWDGLRAVPSEPVKFLGGTRPAYHGQYREVTEREGIKWHTIHKDGEPVVFKLPEAAITEAEKVRNFRVKKYGFKSS